MLTCHATGYPTQVCAGSPPADYFCCWHCFCCCCCTCWWSCCSWQYCHCCCLCSCRFGGALLFLLRMPLCVSLLLSLWLSCLASANLVSVQQIEPRSTEWTSGLPSFQRMRALRRETKSRWLFAPMSAVPVTIVWHPANTADHIF